MRGKLSAIQAVEWARQGCEEAVASVRDVLHAAPMPPVEDVYRAAYAKGYREALADLKRHGIIVPEYR